MELKLALLSAAAASALLASPAVAQQKVKVGNLVDYTGATSSVGKISGPGKVDAFAWINANGGINGKQLEVDTVDYGYKTQRSIQLYKKWKDDGAVAIQGYGTNDTEAMVGFIAEDKIPYFSLSFSGHLTDPSGISAKAKEGKIKPAPYNFFGAPSYSDGTRSLVIWAAEDWKKKGGSGKAKYIHLGDNHPYPLAPKEAGEELARQLGFDVVPSIQYALAGGDFKAQCLALQSSGANYAFLANTTGANVALLRSCATVGVNVQFMANIWGMDEAGMKATGKAVDGLVWVVSQSPWHEGVPRDLQAVRSGRHGLPADAVRARRLPGALPRRGDAHGRQSRQAQRRGHQGRARGHEGLRAVRHGRHVPGRHLDRQGPPQRRHRRLDARAHRRRDRAGRLHRADGQGLMKLEKVADVKSSASPSGRATEAPQVGASLALGIRRECRERDESRSPHDQRNPTARRAPRR
jgi:branched-chain amino acid transport system substrate-binding protein